MRTETKKPEISIALLSETDDLQGKFRKMVARGRGSLRSFLGDRDARQAIFSESLVLDRVLVGRLNGQAVGYLSFQWNGIGPYAPGFSSFKGYFGHVSGALRWCGFHFFERRTRHFGFYVYGLKVRMRARRFGVASALMAAAEARARALGAREICLEVHLENEGARQFYERLGYVCEKTVRLHWFSRFFGASGFALMRKVIA